MHPLGFCIFFTNFSQRKGKPCALLFDYRIFHPCEEYNNHMKKAKLYIFSILLALTVGGLSALATANNMNIYDKITQPPLSPPGWLFPVVWTILFILMGISAAIIFTSESEQKDDALFIYAVSLVLNFSWSIFFFNMQSFIVSFIILVALWLSILLTIIKYYKINPLAAYLQIPYLVWVTFAGYLNLAIVFLN